MAPERLQNANTNMSSAPIERLPGSAAVGNSSSDDFVRMLNATNNRSVRQRWKHVACGLGKPGEDNGWRLHSRYGVRSADDFMVSIRSLQARPVEERQI